MASPSHSGDGSPRSDRTTVSNNRLDAVINLAESNMREAADARVLFMRMFEEIHRSQREGTDRLLDGIRSLVSARVEPGFSYAQAVVRPRSPTGETLPHVRPSTPDIVDSAIMSGAWLTPDPRISGNGHATGGAQGDDRKSLVAIPIATTESASDRLDHDQRVGGSTQDPKDMVRDTRRAFAASVLPLDYDIDAVTWPLLRKGYGNPTAYPREREYLRLHPNDVLRLIAQREGVSVDTRPLDVGLAHYWEQACKDARATAVAAPAPVATPPDSSTHRPIGSPPPGPSLQRTYVEPRADGTLRASGDIRTGTMSEATVRPTFSTSGRYTKRVNVPDKLKTIASLDIGQFLAQYERHIASMSGSTDVAPLYTLMEQSVWEQLALRDRTRWKRHDTSTDSDSSRVLVMQEYLHGGDPTCLAELLTHEVHWQDAKKSQFEFSEFLGKWVGQMSNAGVPVHRPGSGMGHTLISQLHEKLRLHVMNRLGRRGASHNDLEEVIDACMYFMPDTRAKSGDTPSPETVQAIWGNYAPIHDATTSSTRARSRTSTPASTLKLSEPASVLMITEDAPDSRRDSYKRPDSARASYGADRYASHSPHERGGDRPLPVANGYTSVNSQPNNGHRGRPPLREINWSTSHRDSSRSRTHSRTPRDRSSSRGDAPEFKHRPDTPRAPNAYSGQWRSNDTRIQMISSNHDTWPEPQEVAGIPYVDHPNAHYMRYIRFEIGGLPAMALADSGADIAVIRRSLCDRLPDWSILARTPTPLTISGFTDGDAVRIHELITVKVVVVALIDGEDHLSSAVYTFGVADDACFQRGTDALFNAHVMFSANNPIGFIIKQAINNHYIEFPTAGTTTHHAPSILSAALQSIKQRPFTDFVPESVTGLFASDAVEPDDRVDDVHRLLNATELTPLDIERAYNGGNVHVSAEMCELLWNHRAVFAGLSSEPATAAQVNLEFINPDQHPIDVGAPRIPHPKLRKGYEDQTEAWQRQGIIELSDSEWGAPVVCVPKPNGDTRVCVDLSRLNAVIKRDEYHIPHMLDLFTKCHGHRYFTSFDLQQGFMQIGIPDHLRKFFAFATVRGKMQFTRMPMGWRNSVAVFQRALERVLRPLIRQGELVVFVDDIVLMSVSLRRHVVLINEALTLLHDANFRVNLRKCKFVLPRISYLGQWVDGESRSLDASRLQGLRDIAIPKNTKQLRSFISMASYFREYVPRLADLCKPLDELNFVGSRVRENWDEEHAKAFEEIKRAICNATDLVLPDFEKPFVLRTDASDYAVAGTLVQDHAGIMKPLLYISRKLTPAEAHWTTGEKEALAIVHCVRKLEKYLLPCQFIVQTDHANLLWMRESSSPRVLRWMLYLLQFDFMVVHVPGIDNVIPDTLSRMELEPSGSVLALTRRATARLDSVPALAARPEGRRAAKASQKPETVRNDVSSLEDIPESETRVTDTATTDLVESETTAPEPSPYEIRDTERSSPHLTWIQQVIEAQHTAKPEEQELWTNYADYSTVTTPYGSVQLTGDAVIIPDGAQSLKNQLLDLAHEQCGHGGKPRTLRRLAEAHVHWTSMDAEVAEHVDTCSLCQRIKAPATPRLAGPLQVRQTPSRPFERLTVDYLGPFLTSRHGNQHLFVIVDNYTRWCELNPVPSADARYAVESLQRFVARHGVPDWIQSDGARALTGKKMDAFCDSFDINQNVGIPYRPQSQGFAERANREIVKHLQLLCGPDKTKWDDLVPKVQMFINQSPNSAIGVSPHEALYGFPPSTRMTKIFRPSRAAAIDMSHYQLMRDRLHERILTRIDASSATAKRYYDSIHPPKLFNEGDRVLVYKPPSVKGGKLHDRWQGPATIVKAVNDAVYQVRWIGEVLEDVHVSLMQPFNDSRTTDTDELKRLMRSGDAVVEAIVNHRFVAGSDYIFEVKWHGIDSSFNSWKQASDVSHLQVFKTYCADNEIVCAA
jgi:hypothetical protein